jgi:hypothetical protein
MTTSGASDRHATSNGAWSGGTRSSSGRWATIPGTAELDGTTGPLRVGHAGRHPILVATPNNGAQRLTDPEETPMRYATRSMVALVAAVATMAVMQAAASAATAIEYGLIAALVSP